jgi:predicted anti-sigma-YlaC factor YlaD
LISLSKDNPDAIADLPLVEALIDRALELDESYERGAIHTFLINFEATRQGAYGNWEARARTHFKRAMELAGGADAAPLLALAESVCIPTQQRAEFESLLRTVVELDARQMSRNRLATLIAQRRARWLLAHIEHYFTS